jgi:hypothetical protein
MNSTTVYRSTNKEIPNNLAPWQIFILRCMNYLEVWTEESLKRFMMDNINNVNFYIGRRGQTSTPNVGKYWNYIHSNNVRHKIPNINTYYN